MYSTCITSTISLGTEVDDILADIPLDSNNKSDNFTLPLFSDAV